MGAGKSLVGRRLAFVLGWPCYDTDEMVSSALGMSIERIFVELGEKRFRDEETAVLEKLDPSGQSIVVTGGGTVLRPENVRRLQQLGTVVYLTADMAILRERLASGHDRPLLHGENLAQRIETLLREREPLYREAADLIFDTSSLSHDEVAESIRRPLGLFR